MDNLEIAAVLDELADLLEIQGANPFRIRAYRNAVRTVRDLSQSLADMVADGKDLTELPTIGKDIAGYIVDLLTTGRLAPLEEVSSEVPRELVDLMKLEGVGPKKAKRLWKELGVTTVDQLERAVEAGRVEKLSGFGARSAEKISLSIRDFRKHVGRILLSEADVVAQALVAHMRKAPGVDRLEIAGSYRRRKETVGDLDVLVQCDEEPEKVMRHFTRFPDADRVEAAGPTRGTIVLRSGLNVDLRVLPERSYGAALHYFTGSKEHNIAVRKLGVQRGLRISEYGVFRAPEGVDPEDLGPDEGERVAGATEEEVFAAVDLPWIAPELRRNSGEIEAARAGRLPKLLDLKDIRGDLQMHTTWSDGKDTLPEMVRACRAQGYAYLAITDHSPSVAVTNGLDPRRVRLQAKEIAKARKAVKEVRVLHGLEVDILKDGSLDLPDDVLDELDLVVIAVHSHMDLEKRAMTDRVLKAMAHPATNILAHPTGRKLNEREPFALDVEAVLNAAAELGVAVELNANPKRLDLSDAHIRRAKELGVKIAINTDAHSRVGLEHMRYGVEQARRGWIEKGDVLNAMTLRQLEKWLARRKG